MHKALRTVLRLKNTVGNGFLGAKWPTVYSAFHAEKDKPQLSGQLRWNS